MKNIIICPDGVNGIWLSSLIFALERGRDFAGSVNGINYAANTPSQQVQVLPAPIRAPSGLYESPDAHNPGSLTWIGQARDYAVFSTRRTFWAWANHIQNRYSRDNLKFRFAQPAEQVRILSADCTATRLNHYYQQAYVDHIDINVDNIYSDPDLFVKELTLVLAQYGITSINTQTIDQARQSLLATVTNQPASLINQWDQVLWLGWSHSLAEYLGYTINISSETDLTAIAQLIQPYSQEILEFTQALV